MTDGHAAYLANQAIPAKPAELRPGFFIGDHKIGFDFEPPSNVPPRLYWVQTNTGSKWDATEKTRSLRSHIMHETHRQKRRKYLYLHPSQSPSKKRSYKLLAPKGGGNSTPSAS